MLEQEPRRISRRLFLAGTAAAGVLLFLPKQVQATAWIDVGPDAGDLNQKDWFPFNNKLGLITLHDWGGPLDLYDEILGHYGERGHAREQAEHLAHETLRRHPDRKDWG